MLKKMMIDILLAPILDALLQNIPEEDLLILEADLHHEEEAEEVEAEAKVAVEVEVRVTIERGEKEKEDQQVQQKVLVQ